MEDIVNQTKAAHFHGQVWFTIDSPFSGKLITDLFNNSKKFTPQWSNILVDASTNEFGIPEWLTYVTRLPDR